MLESGQFCRDLGFHLGTCELFQRVNYLGHSIRQYVLDRCVGHRLEINLGLASGICHHVIVQSPGFYGLLLRGVLMDFARQDIFVDLLGVLGVCLTVSVSNGAARSAVSFRFESRESFLS